MQFSDAIWWRHNKSKVADGRHNENRFLAIFRHHIGRSTRKLEQRWRITRRYRSCDLNCNFRKFKMADSRHFENSIISISQLWFIRFRSSLVRRCTFQFPRWTFNKKLEILQIQDGGRTPYWKSFLAISRRHIGRLTPNLDRSWRITCRYRSRDQNCNFRKFKMANGRHFESGFISISLPRIMQFRSHLVRGCEFRFLGWSFDKKIEILQIQDGGRLQYWNFNFLLIYVGAILADLCKIWTARDQNSNFWILKMADGCHFENSFIVISQTPIIQFRPNLVCRCEFPLRKGQLINSRSFALKIAIGRCFKSIIGYISGQFLRFTRNLYGIKAAESYADMVYVTKIRAFNRKNFIND